MSSRDLGAWISRLKFVFSHPPSFTILQMDLMICTGLALLEVAALGPQIAWTSRLSLKSVVVLSLIQYLLVKVYRIIVYPVLLSPLRNLPGPKNNTLLLGQEGNKYKADSPISLQLEWSKTWPDAHFIRYISFAGKEVLMVNSLAAYKAVLQTHCYSFTKPPFFARLVGEISGTGLLFAEGDYHKQQRRLLVGPFSVPSVRKILPVLQSKAEHLSEIFQDEIGDKPYSSLEVASLLSRATMEIIGVVSLGVELKELTSNSATGFVELYNRLLHQSPLGQLIWVVNSFIPIRSILPLEANRNFLQNQADLRAMLGSTIRKRMSEMKEEGSKGKTTESRDLLTYMLEEANLHEQQTGQRAWSEDDIIGHLLNYTSAGHETSATMLTWSLYVLATRHDVQEKLRAETALLAQSTKSDYDHLSTLPYLNNFCREVLRVYCPAFLVSREATTDLVIEGVHIPKGTQLDVTLPVIHFHPHVWGTDAAVFDPDRWDDLSSEMANHYAWQPFSQGSRICPGKNLAMIEIKAVLVELVAKWRFVGIEKNDGSGILMTHEETAVGNGIKIQNPAVTYCPAGGIRVRFGPV